VPKIARILVIVASAVAFAQTPQFEVASVKPSAPDRYNGGGMSGGPGTKDPGLFTCDNVRLADLVMDAYDIPAGYHLSGPDWMNAARFDISARIPEATTRGQFKLMQQNLLAERFKMTSHHEQREVPGYDLVVAKNGPKMKEAAPPPPEDPDAPKPAAAPLGRKVDKD
jgi:uncharacterized protein (TIGR03435 family)